MLHGFSGFRGLDEDINFVSPAQLNPNAWYDVPYNTTSSTVGALTYYSAGTLHSSGNAFFDNVFSQYLSLAGTYFTGAPFTIRMAIAPVDRAKAYGLFGATTSTITSLDVAIWLDVNGNVNVTFNGGVTSLVSATPIPSGAITFSDLVITYDGTTCNIWINAIKDANSGTLASSFGMLTNMYWGNRGPLTSGADYYYGYIDAFAVWTSVLSNANIATLYGSGTFVACKDFVASGLPAPVCSYDCDSSVNLTVDYSGNGNTLTNNNGITVSSGPVVSKTFIANDSCTSMDDRSGNNNTATWAGTPPLYIPTGNPNGGPCLRFSSSGSLRAAFTLNQACSLWLAAKYTSPIGSGLILLAAELGRNAIIKESNTWTTSLGVVLDSGIPADNVAHSFAVTLNTSSQLTVDSTVGIGGNAGTVNPGGISIGGFPGGGNGPNMDLYGAIAMAAVATAGQIADVRTWNKTQYGTG